MKGLLPILLLVFSVGVANSNESVIVSCELTGGWVKDTVVLDFNFDERRVVCWKNDLKASIKGGWGSIQGLAPRCNITGNQIELRTPFKYSTFISPKARISVSGSAALYVDIETGNAKSQFAFDEYSIRPAHSFPQKSPAEIRRVEAESALKGRCRKDGRAWIDSNQSDSGNTVSSLKKKLLELKSLVDEGLITEEEYGKTKKRILDNM